MSYLVDRQDILQWSNDVRAGYDLPRILRSILSHDNSTITRLHMPASEGARLPGYDGVVDAAEASILVPAGHSVWELGVEARPSTKASADFRKRTLKPDPADPSRTTYVAVTSRSWPKRHEWAAQQRENSVWKDVRAYDVEDLTAAMDRDVPSALLFCDLAQLRGVQAETLAHWWKFYSESFAVPLTSKFVLTSRSTEYADLQAWLGAKKQYIELRAPSVDDGRAFVAAALDSTLDQSSDLIVCDDVATLRSLIARSQKPLVFVTEMDISTLGPLGTHRLIKINTSGPSTVVLPRQSRRALAELLKSSGVEFDDAERFASAARRSLYRYQLVSSQATHPSWNREFESPAFRRLWLLGGWEQGEEENETLVQSLTGYSIDDAIACVSRDVNSADPIFSHAGHVWRVTVPLESAMYFAERSDMVEADLTKFRAVVLEVLGEIDPALELPESERWLANIKGKARRYGRRIQENVTNTLAALASECGSVPLSRGLTVQDWVDQVVDELFRGDGGSPARWMSLAHVLPTLAEASPQVVLDRIRSELLAHVENLGSLATTAESPFGLGGSDNLAPVLWSLQTLMWSPQHCEPAIDATIDLALLTERESRSPSPIGILHDALLPTSPQSALDTSGRQAAIARCVHHAPGVAKQMFEKIIGDSHGFVVIHRTYFRAWGKDRQRVTWADAFAVYSAIIDGCIALAEHYPELWVTLVNGMDDVGPQGFSQIVTALNALPADDPSARIVWTEAQQFLRRHRQHADTSWALPEDYLERLATAVAHLEPPLARQRMEWLFGDSRWDLGLDLADTRGENSRLMKLQADAVGAILAQEGVGGLVALAKSHPNGVWDAGVILARGDHPLDPSVVAEMLISDDPGVKRLARAYFVNSAIRGQIDLLEFAQTATTNPVLQARLLLSHNNEVEAWDLASRLGASVAESYWQEFEIYGRGQDFAHAETVARNLVDRGRVFAALDIIALYENSIDTASRTKLIISGLQKLIGRPKDDATNQPSAHQIRRLIAAVRDDASVDRALVCQLEWAFFPVFEDSDSLAIEVEASKSAADFMYLVNLAHRPRSESDETSRINPELRSRAFRFLMRMRYTPATGTGEISTEELMSWISEIRSLAGAAERIEIAMHEVGQMLGRVKPREGVPYPEPAIQTALEESVGEQMLRGFSISLFNGRGVGFRGHGGQQEYDLAEKYDRIADETRGAAPRTSAMFRRLAAGYRRDGADEDEHEERIEDGIDHW